jgi:outer membrane biosynthesis protein TonB
LILPFVAVKAQTFQRKTRQPAFFMPQSALSTQQQERLPAIENMNYQGQRPSSLRYGQQEQNKTQPTETKPVVDTSAQIKTQAPIKTEEKIIEKVETKTLAPVKTQTPVKQKPAKVAEKAVKPAEKPKVTAINKEEEKTTINTADNYQETFAQILNRHKADLMRIRQGDYTQSADITAMIESYKPLKKTVSDRITPRSVIIK